MAELEGDAPLLALDNGEPQNNRGGGDGSAVAEQRLSAVAAHGGGEPWVQPQGLQNNGSGRSDEGHNTWTADRSHGWHAPASGSAWQDWRQTERDYIENLRSAETRLSAVAEHGGGEPWVQPPRLQDNTYGRSDEVHNTWTVDQSKSSTIYGWWQ